MNLSAPFVRRPIATVLLTIGVALAGIGAFFVLPVSPLPQVDYPTISVSAQLPGASPETMATSVATPLERRLGTISGVNEMTSSSQVGSARISLQFDLSRDIDGAAREVQAAINASRVDLPATLRSNPTYRKANPSDAPVIILALTSTTLTPGQIYDSVSNIVSQRLAQVAGRRRRRDRRQHAAGGAGRAAAVRPQPLRHQRRGRARRDPGLERQPAEGRDRERGPAAADLHPDAGARAPPTTRRWSSPGATARRCAFRDVAEVVDGVENNAHPRALQRPSRR